MQVTFRARRSLHVRVACLFAGKGRGQPPQADPRNQRLQLRAKECGSLRKTYGEETAESAEGAKGAENSITSSARLAQFSSWNRCVVGSGSTENSGGTAWRERPRAT